VPKRAIEPIRQKLGDRGGGGEGSSFHGDLILRSATVYCLRGDSGPPSEETDSAEGAEEDCRDSRRPFGLRLPILLRLHRAFIMDLLHRWDGGARALKEPRLLAGARPRERRFCTRRYRALALPVDELGGGQRVGMWKRAVALRFARCRGRLSRRDAACALDCRLPLEKGFEKSAKCSPRQLVAAGSAWDEGAAAGAREATQLMRRKGSLARFLDDLADGWAFKNWAGKLPMPARRAGAGRKTISWSWSTHPYGVNPGGAAVRDLTADPVAAKELFPGGRAHALYMEEGWLLLAMKLTRGEPPTLAALGDDPRLNGWPYQRGWSDARSQ